MDHLDWSIMSDLFLLICKNGFNCWTLYLQVVLGLKNLTFTFWTWQKINTVIRVFGNCLNVRYSVMSSHTQVAHQLGWGLTVHRALFTWWTVEGLKGSVVNRAVPSFHVGSLEFTPTVPLNTRIKHEKINLETMNIWSSDQMHKIMEEKMQSFNLNKHEISDEQKKIKQAILASYSQVLIILLFLN